MRRSDQAWNIDVDLPKAEDLRSLKPVTRTDSFDSTRENFHEDGLFSVSIFGRVGDETRWTRFSYIDIRIPVIHPLIFRGICSLKQLYSEVMAGSAYAVFDEETGDLDRSDATRGQTGYAFFLSCMDKIVWQETNSEARKNVIALLKRQKNDYLVRYITVLPAAIRDMEFGPDNRPQEHEINKLYRKLLAVSMTVQESAIKQNVDSLNAVRWMLQKTVLQIFEMQEDMIDGRRDMIQNRMVARRVFNGTRNVISAMDTSAARLGEPGNIRITDTGIGLYQALKGLGPVPIHLLMTGFLTKVFHGVNMPATLVNMKTRKPEAVMLPSILVDEWTTVEGLTRILTSFQHVSIRHRELILKGHYIGLIYKGPDMTFKVFQDIDELPEGRRKDDVYPLTFAELMYCSIYHMARSYPNTLSRYPIQGTGSIYPSNTYLVTTTQYEQRRELSDTWQPMTDQFIAYRFPKRDSTFIDTALPHPTRLAGLDGDHDGDTVSNNFLFMDESRAECETFMKSKKAFVGPDGRFLASTDISPTKLVFMNMTGAPRPRPWRM